MKAIGTAALTNFSEWILFVENLPLARAEEMHENIVSILDPEGKFAHISKTRYPEDFAICYNYFADYLLTVQGGYMISPYDTKTPKYLKQREQKANKLKQFASFAEEFEQPIHVGYWSDAVAFIYLGNPKKGIAVLEPAKYMTFTPTPDWSDITPAEMRTKLCGETAEPNGAQIIPVEVQTSLTAKKLSESKVEAEQEMERINEMLKQTKNAETGELAEIKRQLEEMKSKFDKLQAEKMEELHQMLRTAKIQKDQLEAKIYMLDSQIYDICCYAGETVHFTKIKSGKNAPDTEPVVIYQKLRFLDEDLGRLASIYQIDWNKMNLFEDFLRHSPVAQEYFAPNEKCVMLVRVSKTGNYQATRMTEFFEMLDNYDYYHGKTVGIILRNGENIYLGWTDEERVKITDDLIITNTVTEITPGEEPEFQSESARNEYYEKKKKERYELADGFVSRKFVYSVLQGIVDHSNLLSLPKGTNIGKQGPLVVHAIADNWLEDNRFGTFNDIIKRCNRNITEGDMILTMCSIYAFYNEYNHNPRGIGYNNRTHDVNAPDCKVLPVNKVLGKTRTRLYKVRYKAKHFVGDVEKETTSFIYADEYDADAEAIMNRYSAIPGTYKIEDEFIDITQKVFVSLKKGCSEWTGSDARANFELYSDEFINLTYMNSVWLMWAINSKKLGGWCVNKGEVEYAYAIRYLKKAMEFVKEREEKEKALLDAIDPNICKDPEWSLKLTEWKLSNDERPVRVLTEFQAKRFVKHLKKV